MKIGRTLFWFDYGNGQDQALTREFWGIAHLLNRLLNTRYNGKRIEFINIYYYIEEEYERYPVLRKDMPDYKGGPLSYFAVWDIVYFNSLDWEEKQRYIWEKSCQYIKKSAEIIKNKKLLDAIEYAYEEGLRLNLDTSYCRFEITIEYNGLPFKISLWIKYGQNIIYSTLTVESDEDIYEMELLSWVDGYDLFSDMHRKLEFDGKNIIIKGYREFEFFPIKISLDEILSFEG
ncbi:MAG TPA: hypothetical protein PLW09_05155 [Candidatus Kapabacteria bacterium]|nr:hypothetical protein [Candidatus Kapabacteria bacterium]